MTIERAVDLRLPAEAEYSSLVELVVNDAATRAELPDEQRSQAYIGAQTR